MKRLNSELCILYTENTVRVWPDKSGVTLVVQRDYKLHSTKKNPVASCETTGLNLVVEYSSTANTHPEGVRLVVLKTPPE
jgi:hypothetical protein